MDNFEYSIQISDRDWEEFYSTAEECGLAPVSLATEEELLLSDTEQEDPTRCPVSSKPKLIRVSLCPPKTDHLESRSPQLSLSPPKQTSYKWMQPRDDVLSGSEDEDEFGSVSRFLCQKETCMSKKTEYRTNIPKPKDYSVTDIFLESSPDHPSNESLVQFMRNMNLNKNLHVIKDMDHLQDNTTGRVNHVAINGWLQRECSSNRHQRLVASDDPCKDGGQLLNPCKDGGQLLYTCDSSKICSLVNDPSFPVCLLNRNIPGTRKSDFKRCNSETCFVQESLAKFDQLKSENETGDSMKTYSQRDPFSDGLQHDSVEDKIKNYGMEVTTKDTASSSAVQQKFPGPAEYLDVFDTQSGVLELVDKIAVTPHMLNRYTAGEDVAPSNSTVSFTIRNPSPSNRSPPTSQLASYTNTSLTLAEMYDFMFDDVLELGTIAPMESQEGIVYSPDMYEYFFLDEDGKPETKITFEESNTILQMDADSPEAVAWPEACEFFFAGGPQEHERGGILLRAPTYQTRRATSIFQSLVPNRFRGSTDGGTLCGRDERCISHEGYGRTNVTSITTGSLVPHISSGRGDACLVFLALASWAVKSSDLQSSEGWKTALLANIGALSAISYLRRRRRAWHEPLLKPLEET